MAEHADATAAAVSDDHDPTSVPTEDTTETAAPARRRRLSRSGCAAILGVTTIVALGAVGGWTGFQWQQAQRQQAADDAMLEAATAAAVNLTSIDFAEIDADVRRILDSSTGTFREQFAENTQPFTEVVKQAQSVTESTVSAAGIETHDGPIAKVLVAVTVKTTNAGQPEQEPRSWRMRISMVEDPAGPKMSDVQFVP